MGNSGFSLITSPKRVKIEFFHLLRAPRCRESEIALSLLDRVTFQDVGQGWGPKFAPFLSQLYAMTFFDFCHAVAWTGFYNGEFIVSRRRLAAQPLRMWTFLRDLAAQPDSGWMHRALSSTARNSTAANAAFAHLMERAWNVLFRCVRITVPCCQAGEACLPDACQCLDEAGAGGAALW